jgi:hypothetical protein
MGWRDRQPTLTEVRARVLGEHRTLRAKLGHIDALSTASPSPPSAATTRELGDALWDFSVLFEDHLAMEEADLAPLLRGIDAWGPVRAERLFDEHKQQREMLLALVDESVGETKTPTELAADARWLVAILRVDMTEEEHDLKRLRDDTLVIDQTDG